MKFRAHDTFAIRKGFFHLLQRAKNAHADVRFPVAESCNSVRRRIQIGISTGINALNVSDNAGKYFDLSGRSVVAPVNGVYIVNGKKMIIK